MTTDDILTNALHAAADAAEALHGKEVGNQYRKFAERIPDPVEAAKADVIARAKAFVASRKSVLAKRFLILPQVEEELLSAVTLLEAREGMAATEHLDAVQERRRPNAS